VLKAIIGFLHCVTIKALGKADVAEILGQKTGLPKKDIELMLTAFAETVRKEVMP
jgi:nucleoid DNA-binding protein